MQKLSTIIMTAGLLFNVPSMLQAQEAIQCANLIYAGTRTSRCFSDEFLRAAQRETCVPTERRFKSVKMDSDELFEFPFVLITGEGDFNFSSRERENLKRYLTNGGFLLASAGCSSRPWAESFRREMRSLFPDNALARIEMDHPLFRTVHDIREIRLTTPGEPAFLEGVTIGDKLVVVFSSHGLNDTENTEGCCCCGGNEIANALELNVNILAYSLLH